METVVVIIDKRYVSWRAVVRPKTELRDVWIGAMREQLLDEKKQITQQHICIRDQGAIQCGGQDAGLAIWQAGLDTRGIRRSTKP